MQIQITRSAEVDLLEGYAFYEQQHPGIGDYFLDSLYAEIDSLALYAGIHPKLGDGLHRMLIKNFPFVIYYQLGSEVAIVVAALDCRQNPESITQRLAQS